MVRGGLIAAIGILIFSIASAYPIRATAQDMSAPSTEAFIAKGAWSPTATYRRDDIVTSRGSTWRARRLNKGKVPGQTRPSTRRFWELLARGFNPRGVWLSARKYQPDDLVISNGSTWRAKITNRNKAPVAGPNWEPFAQKGAAGPNTGVPIGTSTAPGISFNSDPGTGIFSPGLGKIALVENGVLLLHNIGTDNTAFGTSALTANTGANNTAIGQNALFANVDGEENTAIGSGAMQANVSGGYNTAVGHSALSSSVESYANTAVGHDALKNANTGGSNTAFGKNAALHTTTGSLNTALGGGALSVNTDGSNNVAIGFAAGSGAGSSPDHSIFIGSVGSNNDENTIRIGDTNTHEATFIAGIYNAISAVGTQVFVNADGQLGTVASSRRYKEDIAPIRDVTPMLSALRPVTFHYKQAAGDGSKPLQYGLIAEEVEKVSRDLVLYNKDGSLQTVRYHLLPPLLLAGYQTQQKVISAQAREIATQANEIAALKERIASIEARLPAMTRTAVR
jgi:hypothetical protein